MLQETGAEQRIKDELKKAAKGAFLGVAKLNVCTRNPRITLVYNTYNPGRQIQEHVVRPMVDMMKSGECSSSENPLIVAVDSSLVSADSLTKDDNSELRPLVLVNKFNTTEAPAVRLEVLAGFHRAAAAQRVSSEKRQLLVKLGKKLGAEQAPLNEDDSDEGEGPNPVDLRYISSIEASIESAKQVIELVETWPVHFYDAGSSQRFC